MSHTSSVQYANNTAMCWWWVNQPLCEASMAGSDHKQNNRWQYLGQSDDRIVGVAFCNSMMSITLTNTRCMAWSNYFNGNEYLLSWLHEK